MNKKAKYSDAYKEQRRKNQNAWLAKKRQDPAWVQHQRLLRDRRSGKVNNEPLVVFVPPYEETVKKFIAEDQQRITDAYIFHQLLDAEPYHLERTTRAVLDDLKREGKKHSPTMTAMLYAVDPETQHIYLCPDLGAMARYYQYKLYVNAQDRKGEKHTIGPIHHRGSVYGRAGGLRTLPSLKRLAEESRLIYTTKQKKKHQA